ncbi:MAG: hypothetical protein JXQ90_16085, partial [Cyclobacteriaceae bacterium]
MVVATSNSSAVISFSDSVWTNVGRNGALVKADFDVSIVGGAAILSDWNVLSHSGGDTTASISLVISGTPDGSERLLVTVNSNEVYDQNDVAYSGTKEDTLFDKLSPTVVLSD